VTSDPRARLIAHNEGQSPHTADCRPWRTLVVIEFDEEEPALEFERYLKTGPGREFARRHFRQTSSRAETRGGWSIYPRLRTFELGNVRLTIFVGSDSSGNAATKQCAAEGVYTQSSV
jgi:putative endonuclease